MRGRAAVAGVGGVGSDRMNPQSSLVSDDGSRSLRQPAVVGVSAGECGVCRAARLAQPGWR